MGVYSVESIRKNKLKGIVREFKSREEAEDFAKNELKKNKSVVVDRISKSGSQRSLVQRGFKDNIAFKKTFGNKYGTLNDFGRFRSKTKRGTHLESKIRKMVGGYY